jgi:hypothetical protein
MDVSMLITSSPIVFARLFSRNGFPIHPFAVLYRSKIRVNRPGYFKVFFLYRLRESSELTFPDRHIPLTNVKNGNFYWQ